MILRRAFLLTNAVIVALILWQGTGIVLKRTSGERTAFSSGMTHTSPAVDGGIRTAREKGLSDFQSIVSRDIFKTIGTPSEEVAKPEPVKEIAVTKLDLRLKGTVLGVNQPSYAVIQGGKGGREELYYLNDRLEGAQILRILSDRVILGIDGREEALIMAAESGPPQVRSRFPSLPRRAVIGRRPPARTNPTLKPRAIAAPESLEEEEEQPEEAAEGEES